MSNKVLVVVAHPDDEILGCGGTINKLVKQNYKPYLLILGEGVTSRDNWSQDEYDELHKNIYDANKTIGVLESNIEVCDYPDNKFDTVALLDIVKTVSKTIDKVEPNIVFTHTRNCLNIDHKITYDAVITSTRPMKDCCVNTILCFEIPSSTEWFYPICFSPNVFINIEDTINKKIQSFSCYKNEIRDYPHPRSIKYIMDNASVWGCKVGKPFVEPFELSRSILL